MKPLVDDHFAILKVGPALTFAYHEAIFALAMIERELFAPNDPLLSPVRQALEASMLSNPSHWAPYYHGDETEKSLARRFSLSDRSRYYWPDPEVQSAIKLLIRNLASRDLPLGLLSQFFPGQFESILNRRLPADPVPSSWPGSSKFWNIIPGLAPDRQKRFIIHLCLIKKNKRECYDLDQSYPDVHLGNHHPTRHNSALVEATPR